jgi:predicted AlkP superfamily phosphohydrolase/phosphomutase
VKILIAGLDGATPELLLGDEELPNLRRLMEAGCYGPLESVVPPLTVPAWMCLATGRDPGSLGVYGFRDRADRSYAAPLVASSRSIREPALWDLVARRGGRSTLVGVPPSYPPRRVNGVCVGCFMTPDPRTTPYTHPAAVRERIERLVGEYPVDVRDFRTGDKRRLRDETLDGTRRRFAVVRELLRDSEWDYFHFVEIGLDRVQHGFWRHHDPRHVLHEPGSPWRDVVRDYYRHLDAELGELLALLTEDTVVLVASDHGAQRLDGGFCLNEWLIGEGLLVLDRYPREVTAFERLDVNWERTRAWGEGGYCGRVFLNVKGREPRGSVEPAAYDAVRDELAARLQETVDDSGHPLGTLVFKPEELYREVRNVAPDLIVHFGALAWRAVGGVGYPAVHVRESDTGPDDCGHAQSGAFVLAASNSPLRGPIEGAHLLDVAPTLLELGGYDVPDAMQGRSLVSDPRWSGAHATDIAIDAEEAVRDRLSGLGYI